MAKGIKSKQKQKWKSQKRAVIKKTKFLQNLRALGTTHYTPLNAFVHPTHPDAVFPQHKIPTPLDFRSEAITPFECPVKSKKIYECRTLPV